MVNLTSEFINSHNAQELFLCVKIALRMGNNATCWPSLETMMQDTGWSKNTVLKVRKSLEKKNSLETFQRIMKNGKQTSNEYKITAEGIGIYVPVKQLLGGSKNEQLNGVQKMNSGGSKNEQLNGVQKMNPNSLSNKKTLKKGQNKFSPPSTPAEEKDLKNTIYNIFFEQMTERKIVGAKSWAIWETKKFFNHYSESDWKISGGRKMKSLSRSVKGWFTRALERGQFSRRCPDDPQFNNSPQGQPAATFKIDPKLFPEFKPKKA